MARRKTSDRYSVQESPRASDRMARAGDDSVKWVVKEDAVGSWLVLRIDGDEYPLCLLTRAALERVGKALARHG